MHARYALLALLLLTACANDGADAPPARSADDAIHIPFRDDGDLVFLDPDGQEVKAIDIEVAEGDSARARGMMQRQSFPENAGMLFLFEREEPQGFYMANTPLSLDIMYVNADSEIVHIAKYTRPYSSETIPSRAPAQYVVETPAGFADTYGITESYRVRWTRE